MQPSPIIRSDDLRTENRARILSTLRQTGPLPRAELGEHTGLSQAALSTLTAQLVDEGVLDVSRVPRLTDKDTAPSRGRPLSVVALASDASHALTVSLTIDRLRAAVVDYAGEELVHRVVQIDSRSLGTRALLNRVIDTINVVRGEVEQERISQIGVAFQGTTGNDTGELLWSPIISGRRVGLGDALTERFGIPTRVNNDCAMIARALQQAHADILGPDFATVLFSHGVGLGVRLNGRAFSGIRSSALELGHLRFERDGALCRCGRRGCIEAYASDYGIERLAGQGTVDDPPPGRVAEGTIERCLENARNGDIAAIQAFAIAGAAVGEGLADLFTLFDPMPVALVGRSDQVMDLMSNALHSALSLAGHDKPGITASIHCFASSDPLMNAGVALDTLDALDRSIASASNDAMPQIQKQPA